MNSFLLLMTAGALLFCTTQNTNAYDSTASINPSGEFSRRHHSEPPTYRGLASWYGSEFHGKRMANGERFNMNRVSVAHKTIPLGEWVRVINLENGRSVVAEVTDRGPYVHGRIVDLSRRAAEMIGAIHDGVVPVRIEVLARAGT